MAKTDFKSVAEYIDAQPTAVRPILKTVRSILKKALPGAEELISYQIPTYKLDGRAILYFAGYKAFFSIYPASKAIREELGEAVSEHHAHKSTLQFALDEPIPEKLIARFAKLRAKEVAANTPGKAAGKTKPTVKAKRVATAEKIAKVAKKRKRVERR